MDCAQEEEEGKGCGAEAREGGHEILRDAGQ